jgi:hypothetical protein
MTTTETTTELTQPEKLLRHLIEQYIDGQGETLNSYAASMDILYSLKNCGLAVVKAEAARKAGLTPDG